MQEGVAKLRKRLQKEEQDADMFASMYATERRAHRKTEQELAELQLIARELKRQNKGLRRRRNVKRKLDFSEN